MTYVVQEERTGLWVMGCCDLLHPFQDMPHETYKTRAQAERAATKHRAEDRAEQEAQDRRLADCCRTCGRPL